MEEKKKKNWILYSQTTNFNSHSHSWYMFLGSSCAFFLHIEGMPIPLKFHQVLFISRLFFLAQLPLKTLALSRIARLCQMNSYQQIIHLCQITNSFFFFIYGCYIQAALVEYLTTWVPVEHKRDKPRIRMQNFYFMQNFNEIFY